MKQRYRERLIGVGREKIVEVAKKYLEEPLQKGLSSKVIFGTEEVNKKELKDAGWKVQAPIEVISNKQ